MVVGRQTPGLPAVGAVGDVIARRPLDCGPRSRQRPVGSQHRHRRGCGGRRRPRTRRRRVPPTAATARVQRPHPHHIGRAVRHPVDRDAGIGVVVAGEAPRLLAVRAVGDVIARRPRHRGPRSRQRPVGPLHRHRLRRGRRGRSRRRRPRPCGRRVPPPAATAGVERPHPHDVSGAVRHPVDRDAGLRVVIAGEAPRLLAV